MSDGQRIVLADAERLALEVVDLLAPACDRIGVAGSIRRQKADIGDIEVIVIPRMATALVAVDLFGTARTESFNALDKLTAEMLFDGRLRYRLNKAGQRAWGEQLKWGLYRDFALDIYTATPETWAVTMLIRTGPAKWSNRLATPKSQYTRDGLRGLIPDHLRLKGWRYVHRTTGEVYDTPTEESVFELLGYAWLPPDERADTAEPRRLEMAR